MQFRFPMDCSYFNYVLLIQSLSSPPPHHNSQAYEEMYNFYTLLSSYLPSPYKADFLDNSLSDIVDNSKTGN